MHSFTISAAFAGFLALTSAASLEYRDKESDYVEKMCFPVDKTGSPDFSAPCNGQEKLIAEGVYGKSFESMMSSDSDSQGTPVANKTQMSYFCTGKGAQVWDLTSGCMNCERLHGDAGNAFPTTIISMVSSAYCAGAGTSTGMTDFLYEFAVTYSDGALFMNAQTATATDVLGTSKTAVSYYYTPASTTAAAPTPTGKAASGSGSSTGSVTGSAASATKTGSANDTSNANGTASASSAKSTGAAGALRAAAGSVVAMAGAAAVVLAL